MKFIIRYLKRERCQNNRLYNLAYLIKNYLKEEKVIYLKYLKNLLQVLSFMDNHKFLV